MTIRLAEIDRSDICLVNLNEDVIANEKKGERPCLIVAKQLEVKFVVIIPITTTPNFERFSYTLTIKKDNMNNLENDSIAEIFQIRAISINRIVKKIGFLDAHKFGDLQKILSQYLGLNC